MITTIILIMVKALDMMMGRSRFSVVVERSLTVGWQSLHRVSMNHLVCPLIPRSHPPPLSKPLESLLALTSYSSQGCQNFVQLSIVARKERHDWKGEEASLK